MKEPEIFSAQQPTYNKCKHTIINYKLEERGGNADMVTVLWNFNVLHKICVRLGLLVFCYGDGAGAQEAPPLPGDV